MPLASVQEIKAGRAIQHGAMEFSTAPVDLDTVRRYRLQRLRTKMGELDVSGLLLFNQLIHAMQWMRPICRFGVLIMKPAACLWPWMVR